MTRARSHESLEAGQQLYAMISHCRRPQELWKKLASGEYDWLGVRADGRFVLGRPRLAPYKSRPPEVVRPARTDGAHRIEYSGPLDQSPDQQWYSTADEARESYAQAIAGGPTTPLQNSGVWMIRLFVSDAFAAEEMVLRRLPRIF